MNDFDYRKYSLSNLEKWIEDAINSSEASPQEIYDVIKKVVEENYYYYKNHTERCYELLALLNGNGNFSLSDVLKEREYYEGAKLICNKDDKSPKCQKSWNDFWEENHYPEEHQKYTEEVKDDGMLPWGHSDMEYLANSILTKDRISNFPGEQYTEEELDAMCDKAELDEEKRREYNLREAEYYNKRAELDSNPPKTYNEMIAAGYTMTDDGFWIKETSETVTSGASVSPKKDKVVKWQLPVEVDGISGEYYVQFPDDLMEAADIKENDLVEWIDLKNGSFELRKVKNVK